MKTTWEQQLTDSLGHQADRVHAGTDSEPIRLADVRSRATRIRRRRHLASAAGVAAVLAVLVPAGIVGVTSWDRAEPPTLTTPSPTPIAEPIILDPATADPDGSAPRLAWVDGGRVRLPGGGTVATEREYDGVTVAAGRVLAQANIPIGPGAGSDRLDELGDDGEVLSSTVIVDEVLATADQSAAVYVTEDEDLVLLTEEGPQVLVRDIGYVALYALEGGDGCARGCVLWHGAERDGSTVRLDLDTLDSSRPRGYNYAQDVFAGGLVAASVSINEPVGTACFGLFEDGRRQWQTCDHALERFSPDGRWLSASEATGDGYGQNELTVLDVETGETLVQFLAGDGVSFARVWEDESHLLVSHWSWSRGTVQLFRVGLDGSVELVVPPRETPQDDAPVELGISDGS